MRHCCCCGCRRRYRKAKDMFRAYKKNELINVHSTMRLDFACACVGVYVFAVLKHTHNLQCHCDTCNNAMKGTVTRTNWDNWEVLAANALY